MAASIETHTHPCSWVYIAQPKRLWTTNLEPLGSPSKHIYNATYPNTATFFVAWFWIVKFMLPPPIFMPSPTLPYCYIASTPRGPWRAHLGPLGPLIRSQNQLLLPINSRNFSSMVLNIKDQFIAAWCYCICCCSGSLHCLLNLLFVHQTFLIG